MKKPIVTKSVNDNNFFYIFRPDGAEVEVKVVTHEYSGKEIYPPYLASKHLLSEEEKNEIYRLL
jgi:hypothetical protein